ncbi:MAG: hypothetical protein AAF757_12550 [Cyanobacteria bacterium P01_D01_bin.116]
MSAKTEAALVSLNTEYQKFLKLNLTASLNDICFTANSGRSHFKLQVEVEGKTTKVKFDAGQAQGLRKGAEFAIYSFGSKNLLGVEERIAIAQITELGASDSWAEITNILNDKSAIEQGAQAVLTSAAVKLVKKVCLLKDEQIKSLLLLI